MTDFLDEIQEEIKEEKKWHIIRRVAPYFLLISIIIVISVSVYVWWEHKTQAENERWGDALIQIFKNNKENKDIIKSLDKIYQDSPGNIAAISGLRKADLLIENKEVKEAIKILDHISLDKRFHNTIKDLAKLKSLSLKIENKLADLDYEEVFKDLTREECAWRYQATEIQLTYLIHLNKKEEAKAYAVGLLNEKSLPENIRNNVQALLSLIN